MLLLWHKLVLPCMWGKRRTGTGRKRIYIFPLSSHSQVPFALLLFYALAAQFQDVLHDCIILSKKILIIFKIWRQYKDQTQYDLKSQMA